MIFISKYLEAKTKNKNTNGFWCSQKN